MHYIIFLVIFLFSFFEAEGKDTNDPLPLEIFTTNPYNIANFTSAPKGIINGCVNVVTGDFFDLQEDLYVEGPEPLIIRRYYSSADSTPGTLLNGWHLSYQGKLTETSHSPEVTSAPGFPDDEYPIVRGRERERPERDGGPDRSLQKGYSGSRHYASYVGSLGMKISFRRTANKSVFTLTKDELKYGVTNCFGAEISARTNMKNTTLLYDRKEGNDSRLATMVQPNNNHLHFRKARKESALILDTEVRPSHSKLTYEYDKNDRLSLVQSFNPSGTVLSNFTIRWPSSFKDSSIVTLIGSDQRTVYYKFAKKRKRLFLLEEVTRPDAPLEYYTYTTAPKDPEEYVLARKERPDGRALEIDYYQKGVNPTAAGAILLKQGHPVIGKVKTLKAPVGHDATLHATHNFVYHFPTGVIGEGTCGVYDIHGIKTDYRWNENLQLTHVVKFDKSGTPYSVDLLEWEDFNGHSRTNLKSRSFTADNKTQYKVTYLYDGYGNVPEEIFEGNIRGGDAMDRLVIRRKFSKDKLRLKLIEDNGLLHRSYTYKENTDLLTSIITRGEGRIQGRQFFDYDINNVLIQVITDNAQSTDRNSLSEATFRKIERIKPRTTTAFNLPEVEETFYVDLATQAEVLFHRAINTYTHAGKLIRKDHYDANNNHAYSLHWAYDGKGNLIEEVDALGRRITRRYDNNQNCIYEQGPGTDSHLEHFYDFSNRLVLTHEVHPDVTLATSYQYNGLSQLVRKTDHFGNETSYQYDEFGRMTSTVLPAIVMPSGELRLPEVKHTYNSLDQVISTTDANGFTTNYSHTVLGKPTSIHYPDGSTNQYEYDIYGREIKAIEKNGSVTKTTYDCLGRPLEQAIYSPAGEFLSKTQSKYTSQLVSFTDPEGHEIKYEYDGAGRVVKEISENREISFEYDPLGRLYRKIYHSDSPVIYETDYDLLNRIIAERVLTQDGTKQSEVFYQYDQAGNRTHVIQEVDGKPSVLQTIYDSHDQPILIIDPEGHRTYIRYDYHYRNKYGQRVFYKEATDPKGVTTVSIYDTHGRVASHMVKDCHGTIIQEREHFFDTNGNLIQSVEVVREADEIKNTIKNCWEYNSVNEVTKEIHAFETPEQKTVAYTYNAFGQHESTVKADGVILTHCYDSLGRLMRLSSSDATVDYEYSFDRNDNVTEIKDLVNKTSLHRTYDANGNISSETIPNGAHLKYSYDGFGNLKTLTLPDQTKVDYEYEGIRLKHVQRNNYKHTYAFDKSGKVTQSGESKTTFNPRGLVTGIDHPNWKASYAYDESGSLVSSLLNGVKNEFDYDSLYQLKNEKGQANHSYKHDSLYNRLEKDGKKHTYNSLNQLVTKDDKKLVYDANGNLIADGEMQLKYDALDRLVSVTKKGQTYKYVYDAFNRRISKTSPKSTRHYLYQELNEIGAMDSKGKIFELRILGNGLGAEIGAAVLMELNGKTYKPIHDAQGNVVCLLHGGKPVAEYSYSAFGELVGKNKNATSHLSPWLFSSKRYDQETGFFYFGRRYYSSEIGRWVTPDPISHEGGPNLYAYVFNKPHLSIDLYGLIAHSIGGEGSYRVCEKARDGYFERNRDNQEVRESKSLSDYFFEGVESSRTNLGYTIACHSGWFGRVYNDRYEKEFVEYRESLSWTENLSYQLGQTIDFIIGVPESKEEAAVNVACLITGPIGKGIKYGKTALKSGKVISRGASAIQKGSKPSKVVGNKFAEQAKTFMKENPKPITKSNLKIGQQQHKIYRAEDKINKEYRLPSGKRIDYLDMQNKIIYELKPHNLKSIQKGYKQLDTYRKELKEISEFSMEEWKITVETY